MQRALEIAREGIGFTSPNPMVGAVIVKDGRIIGEGFHPAYGREHAEVMAIENATEDPRGSIMYCTLEPCSPAIPGKKTPPCSNRLIAEGIGSLYIATLDPNPYVAGSGAEQLREAGIPVYVGCQAEAATRLNEAYFKFIRSGEPFVHIKMAMTLDGRIATHSGHSKWISDIDARRGVHALRSEYDAVMTGVGTVLADDPRFTVRHVPGRQPWRIVLDRAIMTPMDSQILSDEHVAKTMIFSGPGNDAIREKMIVERGAEVIRVDLDDAGKLNLSQVFQILAERRIASVLVEAGSRLVTSLVREGHFDKVSAYIAPMIAGSGIEAVGNLGTDSMKDALRLQAVKYQQINDQILVEGYRDLQHIYGMLSENVQCSQELLKSLAK